MAKLTNPERSQACFGLHGFVIRRRPRKRSVQFRLMKGSTCPT